MTRHSFPFERQTETTPRPGAASGPTLGQYARVYLAFIRNCLAREMEFRGHFFFLVGSKVLWSVLSVALIGVIFAQVQTVAGWTLDEMIVLTGAYLLVLSLSNILFFQNMARLSEYVNRGDLDFVLTKPLDSQFLVSARYTTFNEIPAALLALLYLVAGLVRLGRLPDVGSVLAFVLYLGVALALIYACWFLSVTLVIWSGRIENIHYLMYPFLEMARVPADVFLGIFRPLLTFVVPIAFVSTVPAQALLGVLNPFIAVYGIVFAAALVTLSHVTWEWALRHYSSASS